MTAGLWNGMKTLGPWQEELDGADALRASRGWSIADTPEEQYVDFIPIDNPGLGVVQACFNPPKVWLNATATMSGPAGRLARP